MKPILWGNILLCPKWLNRSFLGWQSIFFKECSLKLAEIVPQDWCDCFVILRKIFIMPITEERGHLYAQNQHFSRNLFVRFFRNIIYLMTDIRKWLFCFLRKILVTPSSYFYYSAFLEFKICSVDFSWIVPDHRHWKFGKNSCFKFLSKIRTTLSLQFGKWVNLGLKSTLFFVFTLNLLVFSEIISGGRH